MSNLKYKQEAKTNPSWATSFSQVSIKEINDRAVSARRVEGSSTLRLITKSGFETVHLHSNQNGSM